VTTRILPPHEWPALAATELGAMLAGMAPDAATVFVTEDDGAIVGAWSLITIAHVEGLWIAPEHRRRGRVLLRLWNALVDLAAARGITTVWTGSITSEVTGMLEARGAHRLPDMFALPLKKGRSS
jgi:GNAT superfamily N-acetyltransferase